MTLIGQRRRADARHHGSETDGCWFAAIRAVTRPHGTAIDVTGPATAQAVAALAIGRTPRFRRRCLIANAWSRPRAAVLQGNGQ